MDKNAEKYVKQARELEVMHDRLAELDGESLGSDSDTASHRQLLVAAKRALRQCRISAQARAIYHFSADNRQLTMTL